MTARRWPFPALLLITISWTAGCLRNDGDISRHVRSKLKADPGIRVALVEVTTERGIVTLKGTIESRAAQSRAVSLATSVDGVVEVNDLLAIGEDNSPSSIRMLEPSGEDADISNRVKARLLDDPQVKAFGIEVNTHQRVVYLSGSVASEEEKTLAIALAQETPGVEKVEATLSLREG